MMVLTDIATPPGPGPMTATRGLGRILLRNALAALAMLVVVGVGAAFWSWHLARGEALRGAANQGESMAVGTIRP